MGLHIFGIFWSLKTNSMGVLNQEVALNIRISKIICLVLAGVSVVWAALGLSMGTPSAVYVAGGVGIAYLVSYWFHHISWHTIARFAWILSAAASVICGVLFYGMQGRADFMMVGVVICPLLVFSFRNELKYIIASTGAILVASGILYLMDFTPLYPMDASVEAQKISSYFSMLTTCAIVLLALVYYTRRTVESNDKLVQALEEVEVANAAKSQFFANVSHEVRTPMNAIMGFAEIIQADETLSVKAREYAQYIHGSGDHLLGIINQVLDLSKFESGKMELAQRSFSTYDLFHEVFVMFEKPMENKGLEYAFELDSSVPEYLVSDPLRLRQVLINMLGNALKFTKEGSVKWSVKWENNEVLVEVADSGQGIADSDLEKVFNPFEQTEVGKATAGSTGLGLPISREMARLLGGDLWVESVLEVGSQFFFSFKAPIGEVIEKQGASAKLLQKQLPIGMEYRILVVDDVPENRLVIEGLLGRMGFNLIHANDGVEALERLEKEKVDVIITDIVMPRMSGFELIDRLKADERFKDIPLVIMSASLVSEEKQRASQISDSFIQKPFVADDLIRVLLKLKPAELVDRNRVAHQVEKKVDDAPRVEESNKYRNIAVAEDNELNQHVVRTLLEQAGHEVEVVGNGVEMLAYLENNPKVDLFLLDMEMPLMGGPETLEKLRSLSEYQNKEILALTGHDDEQIRLDLLGRGFDEVLTKPFKVQELKRWMNNQ